MKIKWHYKQIILFATLAVSTNVFADAKTYEEVYADRIMNRADRNKNRRFEKEENANEWKKYKKLDQNQDGELSLEELKKAHIQYLETGGERKLNILYKQTPEEDLYFDLYYPPGKQDGQLPVIIYTHGGGWGAGNKQSVANHLYGPLFKKLLDHGFCVAAVNYRLWKNGGTAYVPECVADSKDAMRCLAKNSEKFGLDPNYFFLSEALLGGIYRRCCC